MSVKFIGYIGFNNSSETQGPDGNILSGGAQRTRGLDRAYVEAAAKAQEEGGFDRVLVPFGSNSPESQIVAAHAAALTTRLGFLVAHRPGFTQPTLAARQLATLDQLSGGRIAVHIITGGADEEMARDGDHTVKPQRYARTDEYLEIVRQEWAAQKPFDHDGKFYSVKGAFSSVKPDNLPVFFGGSSEEAIEVAGKHADVYATWGETLDQTREIIGRIRSSAARHGRAGLGFSLSLRPVIADTEEAAWKKADEIVEIVRENRIRAGLPVSGHTPPNVGAQRLLQTASAGRRDGRLWTGVAQLTGAAGNSTGLVGTPEQVSDALLDYYELGVDHFLIRGFDPLGDAIEYGRSLIPLTREKVAKRLELGTALAG